ncbi:elongation factor P 5-aminopentanone reductase [Alkalicoccus daliensis]|uniref:3-oxoacyl-[acyl-carrier protein] reductase n=1 Tax=Alkalicoccus daliensis TaxID=745820 RepID=A0A1H0A884_9BACI|nr:SDR family oxidoreductase [Alkalicoccus daliensis]SDN29942.1 3-oxoacyl-[acyl-carrier protein] reductase [Alkalicoccus daliensis]
MKPLAFISGATGAIGEATAKKLASSYRLLLHYHQNDKGALKLQEELQKKTEVFIVQADFTNTAAAVAALEPYAGELELLIHNAGISRPEIFQLTEDEMLVEEMTIGLFTPAAITKRVLQSMISRKKGAVVFVSSIWGETGAAMEVIYSTVKAAQLGFVKSLAKETALSGVKVNAVAPGAVHSPMLSLYSKEETEEVKEQIPLNRFASPEEIAACIEFLAGENSSYIHGHVLSVNGAWYT